MVRYPGLYAKRDLDALGITRQGAANLFKPLMGAGLIRRVGGKKTGKDIKG
jgi:hypothetical protein